MNGFQENHASLKQPEESRGKRRERLSTHCYARSIARSGNCCEHDEGVDRRGSTEPSSAALRTGLCPGAASTHGARALHLPAARPPLPAAATNHWPQQPWRQLLLQLFNTLGCSLGCPSPFAVTSRRAPVGWPGRAVGRAPQDPHCTAGPFRTSARPQLRGLVKTRFLLLRTSHTLRPHGLLSAPVRG